MIALVAVVAAGVVAAAAPPRLTHGPFLGDVTAESARVWCRVGAPGAYRVRVTDSIGKTVGTDTEQASADSDLCVSFEVKGLSAGTRYEYRVLSLLDGESSADDVLAQHGFVTAPPEGAPALVRLAFGSCCNDKKFKEQPVWGVIAAERPDAVVFIGDTPYIDTTDLAVQRSRYGQFFAVPGMRELLCSVPLYSTWDDHDFGANDTTGMIAGKERSRRAFLEYHANPGGTSGAGADGEGIYTKFRRGGVEVFLIDARWFSGTEASFADAEKRTLIGAKQWEWLKAGLKDSTAPYKILTTGMIWNDSVRPNKTDYWGNYAHERDAVLRFVGENRIGGVVLMGGDIHRSRALRHRTSDVVGYDVLELIASPLANDVHANSKVAHPALIAEGESSHSVVMVDVDTRPEAGPGGTLTARCLDAASGKAVEMFRVVVRGSEVGVK